MVFEVTLAFTNVVGLFVNALLLMGVGKVMSRTYNEASASRLLWCYHLLNPYNPGNCLVR